MIGDEAAVDRPSEIPPESCIGEMGARALPINSDSESIPDIVICKYPGGCVNGVVATREKLMEVPEVVLVLVCPSCTTPVRQLLHILLQVCMQ